MILHMLCLLMVMMMFSSVIGAPGQILTMKDTPLARKDEPRPKSSGTLDSIGGGHLLKADSPDIAEHNFRSLELLVSYQDDIPQDMILVSREDKRKPSSSGTLDPLGGGNLVRIIDPEADSEVFRTLESLLDDQNVILQSVVQLPLDNQPNHLSPNLDPLGGGNFVRNADLDTEILMESHLENKDDTHQNVLQLAREDKPKKLAPNLDPIGGGNLVRSAESDIETKVTQSLESHLENQEIQFQEDILQSTDSLAREDKQKHSSSGTLDSIGGGNLLRIVDPEVEEEFYRSLSSLLNSQDNILQKLISLAREDKQKSSSSGTLDPIGGGNLVRIVDPEVETEVFSSLESLIDNQGRQNMMRLAREDKSMQRSSHALEGLGGGHLVDPYRGQIYRSLDHSHLVDTVDQGGDVQRMLDSLTASDLLSLDSAERMAVLNALRSTHTKYPKRMLDSVSGWAFGESKRNFDEIDNVGFTGFAKRGYPKYKNLALAKKNFDEIDRAGFETYNKRDFDEIDRTGFDTFEKRDRKE